MSAERTIHLGKTAWGVLHALARNNGRGLVGWGRRYAQLSPGRAIVFSQVFHGVVAQQLITSRGQNAPGMFVLTDRGIEAYVTGRIKAVALSGPFLDEAAGEPFTCEAIPAPQYHRWSKNLMGRAAA